MKYAHLTPEILLKEYLAYNVASPLRFGQMIWNKYGVGVHSGDPEVFYERNNGVAYKLILGRLFENVS